jgi:hypothetical protein
MGKIAIEITPHREWLLWQASRCERIFGDERDPDLTALNVAGLLKNDGEGLRITEAGRARLRHE